MYLHTGNILLLTVLFIFDSYALFTSDKIESTLHLETVIIPGDSASISKNDYYHLAVEYEVKNTPRSRSLAREYIRKAINLEPENISYRLKLASLLEESFSVTAEEEYHVVLSLDKNNTNALLGLARISEKEFYEWLNSAKLFDENIVIEFNDYAMKDFLSAERNYKSVLQMDSLNYEANKFLALLYQSINKNDEAVFYLNRLVKNYPDSAEVHLNLGLVLYKLSYIEQANKYFLTALDLMPVEQKNEFTFKSVSELLEPVLEDKISDYTEYETSDLFDYYWTASDPLHLTEYNERLIEHYARLVYSNQRFSLKNKNKAGWMTNRGEIVMRYGEPDKTMRIRPGVDWGAFNVKTEVWYYKNMVLGFTDTYSSGEYVFNIPSSPEDRVRTQFKGDTFSFINEFKREQHEIYVPKFEGPSFEIDLSTAQFRNETDHTKTDVYINYAMSDSVNPAHTYGVFLFNNYFEKMLEERKSVETELTLNNKAFINSVCISTNELDGKLAFEIIRTEDKGVSSNHGKYKVKNFAGKKLLISDLLFASEVVFDNNHKSSVNRKNISLIPNPSNQFNNKDEVFIYYEVYNLSASENGYGFEQTFTLKSISNEEFSIGRTIGSILKFVGIEDDDNRIAVTSTIKSAEKDADVYLQLDFSGYEAGDYELDLKIKDLNTGLSQNTKAVVRIN